jgi:hypothetical protein
MKRFLTLTALCALGVAAPATAQYVNVNAGGTAGVYNRIAQLETALQADIRAGVITRSESYRLSRQIRDLRVTADLYARNGFSQRERMDLQARFRTVRQNLRLADNGRLDRYGSRDDNWSGSDWDSNYRDNGYNDRGGPYEEAYDDTCVSRGGIAGLIDNVVGAGCLRVGMRATSNLNAVPYDYRYRFRDGNGVYYRSDGRSIYEIDARTNTVVRIHSMNR